ncbi:MAG: hypothetical protein AVDCRST_MAG05-2554, partial [uncultured Rubrobacteraceae bacterium]
CTSFYRAARFAPPGRTARFERAGHLWPRSRSGNRRPPASLSDDAETC